MRGALLSAIVLAAAWVLGVRTRQARQEAAARARTDERLRPARDVHDALSHSLGAIGVQAGVAAHVTALGEPELRATLQEVESQARSSLLELKSLLHSERSAVSDTGTASLPLIFFVTLRARRSAPGWGSNWTERRALTCSMGKVAVQLASDAGELYGEDAAPACRAVDEHCVAGFDHGGGRACGDGAVRSAIIARE